MVKVNTPLPANLKSEAKKAAKILREFSMPSSKSGPDKIIPAGLIEAAEGLAILTVVKVGFLVTARGGSGIVIAKLPGGNWSAPSAIGIAGLGGGFEIGAEVTDFVIILTKKSAVQAFSKGGNLTLGGNMTIAAGPLGRNLEGDVSLRSPAAIYTYSKTKGLFAGISVEGSALIERKETNKKFYGESIRSYSILSGEVERPESCSDLYDVLREHHEMFQRMVIAQTKRYGMKEAKNRIPGVSLISDKFKGRKRESQIKRESSSSDSDESTAMQKSRSVQQLSRKNSLPSYKEATSGDIPPSYSESALASYGGARPKLKSHPCGSGSEIKAIALWEFSGSMPCDLTFKPGDEILILTETSHQNDWWEGSLHGCVGIFPANYVKVL